MAGDLTTGIARGCTETHHRPNTQNGSAALMINSGDPSGSAGSGVTGGAWPDAVSDQ
jgi:hypothetical protein